MGEDLFNCHLTEGQVERYLTDLKSLCIFFKKSVRACSHRFFLSGRQVVTGIWLAEAVIPAKTGMTRLFAI